jgi:hypothetical protein
MPEVIVSMVNDGGDDYLFDVRVREGNDSTTHRVTVSDEEYNSLAEDHISPGELVKKSFEFLLEREPRESILKEFGIMDIAKYFPEYLEEVHNF